MYGATSRTVFESKDRYLHGVTNSHLAFAATVVFSLACQGTIGAPESTPQPPSETGPADIEVTVEECAEVPPSAGIAPLRRLTRDQYEHAVSDMLGAALPTTVRDRLRDIPDGRNGGFNSTTGTPSTEVLRTYLSVAEELAPLFVDQVECTIAEQACARDTLRNLARRAFRRPTEDVSTFMDLYRTYRDTDSPEVGLETAITAVLASPAFIYHAEPVGEREADALRLDAFALANRLSFFMWNSPPDDALLDAAEAGVLDTPEGLESEVRRLASDDRIDRQFASFYGQWLRIEAVRDLIRDDPEWSPELRDRLVEETNSFVEHVMKHGDGTLRELLTASYTIGDEMLAAHYGGAAPDAEGRIELNPDERAGLLTQAGIMAELGTVFPEIHRGFWVRNNFLCDPPPPPPGDVVLDPTVDRLETSPCVNCHLRMDPIGHGFDVFDDLGRYRPELASEFQPTVVSPDDALEPSVVGDFAGPRELAERLAGSTDVEDCVSVQWFRYAMGRWEDSADACSILDIRERFTASGGDMTALAVAIATSTPFRSRSIDALTAGDES